MPKYFPTVQFGKASNKIILAIIEAATIVIDFNFLPYVGNSNYLN